MLWQLLHRWQYCRLFYSATILFLFWVQRNICSLYVHARNSRAQILPFCILVKQYQACRAGFYHEACSEIHWHTKIFSPAFPALCSCCVCGSCCSFLFLCCVRLPYQSTNVASFSFWRNLPAGQAGTGG